MQAVTETGKKVVRQVWVDRLNNVGNILMSAGLLLLLGVTAAYWESPSFWLVVGVMAATVVGATIGVITVCKVVRPTVETPVWVDRIRSVSFWISGGVVLAIGVTRTPWESVDFWPTVWITAAVVGVTVGVTVGVIVWRRDRARRADACT